MQVIAILILTLTTMITITPTITITITITVQGVTRIYLKATSPGAVWLRLPLAAG